MVVLSRFSLLERELHQDEERGRRREGVNLDILAAREDDLALKDGFVLKVEASFLTSKRT